MRYFCLKKADYWVFSPTINQTNLIWVMLPVYTFSRQVNEKSKHYQFIDLNVCIAAKPCFCSKTIVTHLTGKWKLEKKIEYSIRDPGAQGMLQIHSIPFDNIVWVLGPPPCHNPADRTYMSYKAHPILLVILIIKPTRCTNSQIYFWNKTSHVLDSFSVHHQEFFTVQTSMVYVIQVCWKLASRIRIDTPWSCSQAASWLVL